MQYEEYRDRMVAQGRTPADRERYASQVEAGYMLSNLDKDEFCQLPDRAIAELSRAANRLAEYDRRADAARPLYGCNVCAAVRDITARMRAGVIPPHRRDEELLAYLADRIEEALGCMGRGTARVVKQKEED